jgi:hypothetical protein
MSKELPVISNSRLNEALAKAQGEFKVPTKTREVKYNDKKTGRLISYKYADLADVIECVKGPLTKNGLSIVHKLEFDQTGYLLKTSLMHESGETIDSIYPLPDPSKIHPQSFGSSLTYARRYSLSSLIGVASEEDDDGQGAESPEPVQQQKNQKPIPNLAPNAHPEPPVDEFPPDDDEMPLFDSEEPVSSYDYLSRLVKAKGITASEGKDIIKRVIGIERSSKDLTVEQTDRVIKYIEQFKK